ncbi:MAG: LapA family protein [Legionellaceae bacterium]|nr:LapA family protein [Legionellaceae bacterium]
MRALLMIFYIVLIVFGVSFAALNADSVTVNFYFTEYTLALSLLLLAAVSVGAVIGFVLFLNKYMHLKRDCKKCAKQLHLLEKEIKNLRVMPLKDQH